MSELPRPCVVLVDDSREVRAVIRRLLEASGFEIVGEGGDGDEAIVLALRHQPDLLLLDTSMPKVDGIEALPAILAISPETKVVMFTGFEEPGLAARARELGAADFVEKSLLIEDLPERLMRVFEAAVPGDGPVVHTRPRAVPEHPVHAEERAVLHEHVQQFRELFDRAEIGMATVTSSGSIVRANRALAALMSCSPYDLIGVDYGRLTVGRGDELDRHLEAICSRGADLRAMEHEVPSPPGVEGARFVRATLAPIRDSRHHVLYVFAQVQDVTAQRAVESDLRRSEENFRRLVTAVEEYAIFLLDLEGTVISWNSGAQRIKGYTSSEIVGQHFRVFYPREEQDAQHPERNLELALRDGSHAEEGWRLRKDGSRFWAMVVITPVYDEAGQHVAFAKVTRDQTRQRELDEERRDFADQRDHLLSMTAHELRTPTAVIDGSASVLRASWDELSTGDRDEFLRAIRSGATRLRRLASDMSMAAAATGDPLPLHLEEVSLTDLLRSAAGRAQAAGVDIHVETEIAREGVFEGDSVRLGQALDNLLDNAVRHGRAPVCLVGEVGDAISIRVTDGGPGVPADLEPRLFERFAVGDSGGTGLGLYFVREIAGRHGGDVTYRAPTEDAPTTLAMSFPLVQVSDRRGRRGS